MIGIDLAKSSFQVHGARADGSVAFRRKLSRAKVLEFLASQPHCTVVMEACASAHYWGREIGGLGHAVQLIPPVYVKAYVTRDGKLACFGVRVLPSSRKRFFVHCQHRGERVWKVVADANSMNVAEARSRAGEMLAAIRWGEDAPRGPGESLFEAVAETVFRCYERTWKARTLEVNRGYLRQQLLPHFSGRPVADIDRREVRNWFASLRATPVAADRSMPVLSVIMREAEAMGLRTEGSNPCRGVPRYRRKGRERFLSDDEIRRLSAVLAAHAGRQPLQVALVRLLLLTGCRKSEILTLRWSDYREGRLFLRDSKTGPRTVWLSSPARNVLDGIERTGRWIFPAPRTGGPQGRGWLDHFWSGIRAEAMGVA